MAKFSYEAINKLGKQLKGTVEANDAEDVKRKLTKQGLVVMQVTPQSFWTQDIDIEIGGYPTPRDLSVMCRQFVSMTNAGVAIMETMRLLCEQTENKKLKTALQEVRVGLEKGDTLAQAMADHPKIFPDIMVNMVHAGETSGTLAIAMERVSVQLEKSSKTRGLVKKAMVYPIAVLVVAIVVTILMLIIVIPSYESMFADLGSELPAITRLYVNMSNGIRNYWFIIVPIIALLVVGMIQFARTDIGKHFFGKIALTIPFIKNLVVKSASSQMARTLSTLLAAGVPLVEGMSIVSNTMKNVYFKEALKDAADQISIGMPLSRPLEDCGLFPPMVYQMISIGEEAGNIEDMLNKLADYYDEEVEMAVQTVLAAMEPLIIIVLAVVVGGLVAACIAPMLSMYQVLDTL